MKKDNRVKYVRRDNALDAVMIDLPDPARIKNEPMKAALIGLQEQQAKNERRKTAIDALAKRINTAERRVEVEGGKSLDGLKNEHKAALKQVATLREDAEAALENLPRGEAKLAAAAGEVLSTWQHERKAWTLDLEQEARDLTVELVGVKLTLDRLSEDFDSTLGVLAGYSRYDTNPRHRGAIAPHAIEFDLTQARDSLRAALLALEERGF